MIDRLVHHASVVSRFRSDCVMKAVNPAAEKR